jgi:stearoyl-CoA desaturase (delta-9 desaturase)
MHLLNYHKTLWYPIHLLVLIGLFYTDYTWSNTAMALIGWVLIAGLGSAVGLHRMLSHKAVNPKPMLRSVISYLGTLACQGSTIFWVALHRGYHHRAADTERDIHSPIKGWWISYFGWTYGIKPDSVNLKYAIDLTKEPLQMFLHKNYYFIIWGTWIIVSLLAGWNVTLWLILIPTLIAMHTDYLTNLLGHVPKAGYRNYNRTDLSTNVPWLAFITWGQCWHNNHHEKPNSYDFGTGVSGKWWEFDPCRLFLFLFKK